MSKSILNRIRIFQENISPALGPGQSRPNIVLKNAQVHFYSFVDYFLVETDLRMQDLQNQKFHTTLQPDTFSIFVNLFFRFSFSVLFILRFSHFSFQSFSLFELFVFTRFD